MNSLGMEKKKSYLISTAILLAIFILFTVSLFIIDYKAVGPEDSKVGYSTMNKAFFESTGVDTGLETFASILGYFAFVVVAIFAAIGIYELVTRKSLFKVDRPILILGAFYIIVLILYIIFNKFAINYRPVILDAAKGLESSYPSSHTMLAICVFMSAITMFKYYLRNDTFRVPAIIICFAFMLAIVSSRALSGVHWLTDIIGGILLSMLLLNAFRMTLYLLVDSKKHSKNV